MYTDVHVHTDTPWNNMPCCGPATWVLMETPVIVIGLPSGCISFLLANQSFSLAVFVTKSDLVDVHETFELNSDMPIANQINVNSKSASAIAAILTCED